MHKNKALIAPLGLVGITILSGVFLMSSCSYATSDNTDVVDDVSITVPVSCSMEGTGMNSHNANIVNGTYQADIGSTTLKAFCNDTNGFAIYATGYTGNEIGETNSNKLVGIPASIGNIDTGTATSGNTSNWAMKLATDSNATYAITLDNGFGSYSSVPNSYTKVAHRDSGTDIGTTATGASLTSTYAAFMSQTQPAGTYSGQVIYTLVHPSNETPAQPVACEAGKICYNANTATALGQMGKQTVSNNTSVTLYAPNFKRDGYGFAGWNTEYDYSGTNYGPNQTITTPNDVETNGLSLYAVWIKSAGSLQNWAGCSGLASGATTALTDSRDGNTYAVAKLADGKCWMIENLRLADKDSSNNDINLSNTNTHNPSLPLTNVYDTSITSNHLSPTSSVAYDATTAPEGWCSTHSTACDDQSRLRTDNTTLFANNTALNYSVESNVYNYGNYYNWYSATVGYGKYGSNYGNGYHSSGDICPVGWHLPKGANKAGESNNEFWALIVTGINNGVNPADYSYDEQPFYTGNTEGANVSKALRVYPNNFVYSGYVNGSSTISHNTYGYYWSASGSDDHTAYNLFFNNNRVDPGTIRIFKYGGCMVRCIAGV